MYPHGKPYDDWQEGMIAEWVVYVWPRRIPEAPDTDQMEKVFNVSAHSRVEALDLARHHCEGKEGFDFQIYEGPNKTRKKKARVFRVLYNDEIIWPPMLRRRERNG